MRHLDLLPRSRTRLKTWLVRCFSSRPPIVAMAAAPGATHVAAIIDRGPSRRQCVENDQAVDEASGAERRPDHGHVDFSGLKRFQLIRSSGAWRFNWLAFLDTVRTERFEQVLALGPIWCRRDNVAA